MKRNAEVGADIANSIMLLTDETVEPIYPRMQKTNAASFKPRVVVVGGAVIDTIAKSSAKWITGTSNPGDIHCADGGVGRNVAEVLGRLGLGPKPLFYTAIGNDDIGHGILTRLKNECRVITTTESVYVANDFSTAQYLALLDNNSDLVGGVADMQALSRIPIPSIEELRGVEYLVLDSNAPVEALVTAARNATQAGALVSFEPTSIPKAILLSSSNEFLQHVSFMFPNEDELFAMAKVTDVGIESGQKEESTDEYTHIRDAASKLLMRMVSDKAHIIITLGSRGVLLASKTASSSCPVFMHFPADAVLDVKSSNGAGDTLCGAFIHALMENTSVEEAIKFGMKAALLSLDCAEHAISPQVSSLRIRGDATTK